MRKHLQVPLLAVLLTLAFSSYGYADPDSVNPGAGITNPGLLALITNDDLFATTDLSVLLDPPPPAPATQHYGPYPSMSTDSGTCGNDWANDTFDRHFTVQTNADETFTVIEQFKNGIFVTPASDSPPVNFSPGACQNSPTPAGTVNYGITGSLHGYFIITNVTGPQTSMDSHCNATTMSNTNCDTTTFVNTHFPPCYQVTCTVTTFFFHYSAGDQSLLIHEWKNASADRGGNSGDIRSVNAP
jgi:hypothetical protein